jgi:hypothetical protein
MSKSDYYRAWLLGIVCGMSFLSLFYMVNVALDTKELQPQPKSNFEVVDTYNGCKCPVMDNEEMPDDRKWVNGDCPIHGKVK